MQTGDTMWLTATVTPEDALNHDVIWVSEDPSVAVVSASGEVTAAGIGITTVKCWALGNDTVQAICVVMIQKEPTASTDADDEIVMNLGMQVERVQGDGVNLLTNSENMSGHIGVDTKDGTYNDLTIDYCVGREISEYRDIGTWDGLNYEPNTEYTLSFYMRGSGGTILSYMYPYAVVSGYDTDGGTRMA